MRKHSMIILLILTNILLFPQDKPQRALVESSFVLNIEVPVRVFKGGDFIDDLKIKDFEVWESGVKQKIEAVYLINKDDITRKEEKNKNIKPQTERTFFLFFEIIQYDPRLLNSVDFFIENVLQMGDNLIVVTPQKTYRLKDEGIEKKPKPEIAKELRSILKKDIIWGGSDYHNAVKELEELAIQLSAELTPDPEMMAVLKGQIGNSAGALDSSLEETISQYRVYLQRLEMLREIDQLKLLDFAEYLKRRQGQNTVYIFYQREFIPQIDQKILIQMGSSLQDQGGMDLRGLMADIMDLNRRDITVDIEKTKRAFADASASIHFMFITRPSEHVPGVYFAERSSDVFTPFMEMAKASGGFVESSANSEYLFKNALAASENYYLLYYSPKNYAGDGEFKEIKVKVTKKGYKIVHRLGYFAN